MLQNKVYESFKKQINKARYFLTYFFFQLDIFFKLFLQWNNLYFTSLISHKKKLLNENIYCWRFFSFLDFLLSKNVWIYHVLIFQSHSHRWTYTSSCEDIFLWSTAAACPVQSESSDLSCMADFGSYKVDLKALNVKDAYEVVGKDGEQYKVIKKLYYI